MTLKITSDLGVVLLAAGRQERFGGCGSPKCLAKVGGVTIYERLREKLCGVCPGLKVVTVVNDQWAPELQTAVAPAVVVPFGLPIGYSIAAGLRGLIRLRGDENGHALIVAADTWIPEDAAFQIPPWIGAIVDPAPWITIFRVGANAPMAAYFESQEVGRAEYLTRPGVRAWIRFTGYININTPEDLERAEKGEREWYGL